MENSDLPDPFAYMIDLCYISPTQEEYLRGAPSVGESVRTSDDAQSPAAGVLAPASTSTGIRMLSLSESPGNVIGTSTPQGVIRNLPRESSEPETDNKSSPTTSPRPTVQIHDSVCYSEGGKSVDLGRDSDLGFSETQRILNDSVAEQGACVSGAGRINLSRGLQRELSLRDGVGELPAKKQKLFEQNMSSTCEKGCSVNESQKGEENTVNLKGKMVIDSAGRRNDNITESSSEPKFPGSKKGVEIGTSASEKYGGGGGIPTNNQSFCRENSETYVQRSMDTRKASVFDVLKTIAGGIEGRSVENISLVEAAKRQGMTFPRPRWWPDKETYVQRLRAIGETSIFDE